MKGVEGIEEWTIIWKIAEKRKRERGYYLGCRIEGSREVKSW